MNDFIVEMTDGVTPTTQIKKVQCISETFA